MKEILMVLTFLVVANASNDGLVEKTVYNAACESKKILMSKDQHGWLDETNHVWLENGYILEHQPLHVRKCDTLLDTLCIKCKE